MEHVANFWYHKSCWICTLAYIWLQQLFNSSPIYYQFLCLKFLQQDEVISVTLFNENVIGCWQWEAANPWTYYCKRQYQHFKNCSAIHEFWLQIIVWSWDWFLLSYRNQITETKPILLSNKSTKVLDTGKGAIGYYRCIWPLCYEIPFQMERKIRHENNSARIFLPPNIIQNKKRSFQIVSCINKNGFCFKRFHIAMFLQPESYHIYLPNCKWSLSESIYLKIIWWLIFPASYFSWYI